MPAVPPIGFSAAMTIDGTALSFPVSIDLSGGEVETKDISYMGQATRDRKYITAMQDGGTATIESLYAEADFRTLWGTDDSPPTCWQAIGINRYDPYPTDPGAVAVSVSGNSTGDALGLLYEVSYKYTSKPFDTGNTEQNQQKSEQQNGANRPWTVTFGSVHKTRLLGPKDVDDKPVVNSAKQPFNPPPEVPCSNLLITFTGYKDASYDPIAKANLFLDAINDADWTPFPALGWTFKKKTVKVNEVGAEYQYENNVPGYKVTIVVECSFRAPWNPVKVLDAGTLQKPHGDPANPPEPILDKQGQPIQSPVPLGGNGLPLAWNAADLFYIDFKGYFEVPFNTLLN